MTIRLIKGVQFFFMCFEG